jgi:molecular chaperone DnaJ
LKKLKEKKKKVSFKIPAGVDNGSRMRLTGEGEGGRLNGQAGDLYVFLYVEPHEYFQRDGNDIYLEMPVSISQATLGCKPMIPTIHGEQSLKIPAGSQTDQRFTLRSKGVKSLRGGSGQGDMIVIIRTVTPDNLTDRQKELLEEFDSIEQEKEEQNEEGFFKKFLRKTA